MDFARKQLEKYGWVEGRGLGKNEDGISTAIRPKLKFDNAGVGHSDSEQFNFNWWENIYNTASSNIDVVNNKGYVKLKTKSDEVMEIMTKNYSTKHLKKQNKHMEYGWFLKTSKLTDTGTVNLDNHDIPEISHKSSILSDEELFAACGGRTAHKGARHGLKLSGKLSRIEKQEKMLLKKLQNVSLSDESKNVEKKIKKISEHKEKGPTFTTKAKKKRKKENKRVSFNETVTEFHSQDLDTSIDSEGSSKNSEANVVIIQKAKIKDEDEVVVNRPAPVVQGIQEDSSIQDEGIDCTEFDIKEEDTSDLYSEEVHSSTESLLSKKEKRKIFKEKRRFERRNRATLKFLEEVINANIDEKVEKKVLIKFDDCNKSRKRSFGVESDDFDESDFKKTHMENVPVELNKKARKRYKKRHRKREDRQVDGMDGIVQSLNKNCKISDTE